MTTTPVASGTVVLPVMLHARPAAVLARIAAELPVRVTIDGVDAASVLSLMRLGAEAGQMLQVEARGPGAEAAVEQIVAATAGLGAG